jgi:uncharacterized protein (DUF2147 family)
MRSVFFAFTGNRFSFRELLILACGVFLDLFPSKAFAASPVGLWYAEGGAAQVLVFPCSDARCGKVVWLRSPLGENGCDVRDDKNPDSTLRGRPIVGLVLLTGLKPVFADHVEWTGGSIYDPGTGHTYSCKARLEGDDKLFLRGYFGIQL